MPIPTYLLPTTVVGRNDSSANGSLRSSDFQCQLSGDESEGSDVATRPEANGRGAALGGGDAASGVVGTSARSDSGGLEADLECLSHIILFEYHQRDAPKYG